MKTALIHDWLTSMRGGEKVLEELCILFPDATIFTLFHRPGAVSNRIESMRIQVSPLNRLPGISRYYRNLLPLLPWAVARFDLQGYDLIISNSHAVAKGIRKPHGSLHVCSCLTPMRYIWDMMPDYFQYGDTLGLRRTVLHLILSYLRRWDTKSADSVDHFVANSHHVQTRIARVYSRRADVIYSPVDTAFFTPSGSEHREIAPFFLIVSALVSYKRIDLAIDTFNQNGYRLVIVGEGPDLKKLRKRAGSNIEFRGFESAERLRELYRTCAAVIIPGREDFGLVSLEAQACGRPPIAFAMGGSLETITDGATGILFGEQTVTALSEAVGRLMRWNYQPHLLRRNAESFSRERFRHEMGAFIREKGAGLLHKKSQPNLAPTYAPPLKTLSLPRHRSLRGAGGFIKRAIDVLISLSGLLLAGVPLLVLAWIIQRNSPGPGLFPQTRLGLNGRPFVIYKLRTMAADAEQGCYPSWTVRDDPRCTRIGNVLRRWGLDELPQLWNVLKGDMTLIGPRPERPEFHSIFARAVPSYELRLMIKGGITGLAQIRGFRGDTSIAERLRCDIEYIERWSLWRDIVILLKTPFSLMRADIGLAPGWGLEDTAQQLLPPNEGRTDKITA